MPYEIFKHKFAWAEREKWLAPTGDLSTPVHFDTVTKETSRILRHVTKFDTCIQAGGNIGLWAHRYALEFDRVFTFEPCADNFYCLARNLGLERVMNPAEYGIIIRYAALGDRECLVEVKHSSNKRNSYGARYVEPAGEGPVRQITLDSLEIQTSVGLIQLDIEGSELNALYGARRLITRDMPVMVLEVRQLPHMRAKAEEAVTWLARELGYTKVDEIDRNWVMKYV